MQIVFHVLNPQPLKFSLIYERKVPSIIYDEVEEGICLFIQRLATSFSLEPFEIERRPDITFENFSAADFHSHKKINLIFHCLQEESSIYEISEEKSFSIKLHFDSADKKYIDKIIEVNQHVNINRKGFDKLNTVVTEKN